MKCSLCNKEAVVYVRRIGRYFCEYHFSEYVVKQVKKYLEKHQIKKKKILVSVSGGKDSMVMFYILNSLSEEFKLDITPFYINLGISNYSDPCESKVIELSEKLGHDPLIIKLKDVAGYTIDDISKIRLWKTCSVCGVVKRYLTNKVAYEGNYDYVATGHTLIDEFAFAMHNLYSGSLDSFFRSYEITETRKDLKLIGRIKPLYYLLESETLTYAMMNSIPYCELECPHARGHPMQLHKEIGLWGEYKLPGYVYKILHSLNKIRKEKRPEIQNIKFCKICGYPTTSAVCKYCRIKERIQKRGKHE